jgi:hypothetical protein
MIYDTKRDEPTGVMPALVAGIHVLLSGNKSWMAGTSPAMTMPRVII